MSYYDYTSPTYLEQAREEAVNDARQVQAQVAVLLHWAERLRAAAFKDSHGVCPLSDDRVADPEWVEFREIMRDVLPEKPPTPHEEAAMLRLLARQIGLPVPTVEWWNPNSAPGGDLPGQPVGGE